MLKLTKYEGNIKLDLEDSTLSTYGMITSEEIALNTSTNITSLLQSIGTAYTMDNGGSHIEPRKFEITMVFIDMAAAESAIALMLEDTSRGRIGKLWCHSSSTNTDYSLNCNATEVTPPEFYKDGTIKFTASFFCPFPYWMKATTVSVYKRSAGGTAVKFRPKRNWTYDAYIGEVIASGQNEYKIYYMIDGLQMNSEKRFDITRDSDPHAFWLRFADKSISCGYYGYNFSSGSTIKNIFQIYSPCKPVPSGESEDYYDYSFEVYYGPANNKPIVFTVNELFEVPR